MAKSALQLEIEGLKELQRSMTQAVRDLGGPKLLETMRDVTLSVLNRAKKSGGRGADGRSPVGWVPVDTGRLAASITPEITRSGPAVRGIVGSRVDYAPAQEFGFTTRAGTISQGPRLGQPYKRTKVEGKFYLRQALKERANYIRRKFRAAVVAIFERKRD